MPTSGKGGRGAPFTSPQRSHTEHCPGPKEEDLCLFIKLFIAEVSLPVEGSREVCDGSGTLWRLQGDVAITTRNAPRTELLNRQ